jgi:hypothetical protein
MLLIEDIRDQNPEVRYREGYEEGAYELFCSLRKVLPAKEAKRVEAWLGRLNKWRVQAQVQSAKGNAPALVRPPAL